VTSPEVEYVFKDNHAIEFEFAIEDAKVTETKFGYQYTIGNYKNYQHGLQGLAQFSTLDLGQTFSGLYLSAYKWNKDISSLFMTGIQHFKGKSYLEAGALDQSDKTPFNLILQNSTSSTRFLFHGNFFLDNNKNYLYALEFNFRSNFKVEQEILILPNIVFFLENNSSVTIGTGINKELGSDKFLPVLIFRGVIEF
jgi:hypothetical protein